MFRDCENSVEHTKTGLLARTEAEFASAWAALALAPGRRAAMGEAARRRASQLTWSTAVQHFSAVIDEAIGSWPHHTHRDRPNFDILPRLKAGDSSYYTDWSSS